MKCCECDKDAEWIRYTQFAGEHPFCDEHAKKELDFKEFNSYKEWHERQESGKGK